MKCLRIFGAYSYRLSRRHSTFLLISSFIFVLTIILQLYSQRHNNMPSTHRIAGDYDYKPGSFLKGKQPNENETYCQFNYGLPETLKWGTFDVFPSPELGNSGPFRIIYNAIKGTAYENASKHNRAVTYVTQATPEFLYHIIEIAKYWDGPISLSVFVPDYDVDITMQIMDHICRCYEGMSKVSLHLFYNKANPPVFKRELFVPETTTSEPFTNETIQDNLRRKMENYRNLNNETRASYVQNSIRKKIMQMMARAGKIRDAAPNLIFNDCSGLQSYDIPTFRRRRSMAYPINVGRNSARNASRTNYVLVSDIEMVPSDGLARKFLRMLKKLIGTRSHDNKWIVPNTVFIVPLFEVERGERIPRNKEDLVNLIEDNRATYFHQKICSHCQRFPGMQMWLKKPPSEDVQPLLIAKREYPYHRWEPLYFGSNKDPWYGEMLFWEGQQDKMTQALELCLLEYDFIITTDGFLVHSNYPPLLKIKKNDKRPLYFYAYYVNSFAYYYTYLELREKYKKYTQMHSLGEDGQKCMLHFNMEGTDVLKSMNAL